MKEKILTCITCKEDKSLNDFPYVAGGYYSRSIKCKDCSGITIQKSKFNRYQSTR